MYTQEELNQLTMYLNNLEKFIQKYEYDLRKLWVELAELNKILEKYNGKTETKES